MTAADRARLRELAEAMQTRILPKSSLTVEYTNSANPAAVLALLDALDRAEAERDEEVSRDILAEMKAARDRAQRRLDVLDFEITIARSEIDEWDRRITRAEHRRARRKAGQP